MTRAEYLLDLILDEAAKKKPLTAYEKELRAERMKQRRITDRRMKAKEADDRFAPPKRKGHFGQELDWDQKR